MTESAMNGQAVTGIWKRYLGWTTVSLLVAFLINNFLNIYLVLRDCHPYSQDLVSLVALPYLSILLSLL